MSEIKVNKITPRAACGTTQLGDSGDTITIPSGATIQNLGTSTGFGGTGVVSWETSSIKTAGFTAVTGTGYFCDTTGGAFTVTLPLSPAAGAVVGVADYAKTFDTDNLTLGRNGSNISGGASDASVNTEGIAVTLVYVDATKGWLVTDSGNQDDAPLPSYIAATGGCITTCGNFKVHTFQSPGTFTVCSAGNTAGSNTVDYLVVGSGASGGNGSSAGGYGAGGGGAGGYRESSGAASGCYTVSPLGAGVSALPVTATGYPVTVGGGAAIYPGDNARGNDGSVSVFAGSSTITSAGGGSGGGSYTGPRGGGPGGAGGGSGGYAGGAGGTGNTPFVSPAQGMPGGAVPGCATPGAGGGGAIVVGGDQPTATCGTGGNGGTSSINFTPTTRAGGGAGGALGGSGAAGGSGGGGASSPAPGGGTPGTQYLGGGGGGASGGTGLTGGAGGDGIVIIRYRYQ